MASYSTSCVSASAYSTLSQLSQPTTEDRRNLAGSGFRAGDEGSEELATGVLCPSVEHLGILKMLALGLGVRSLTRKKRSGGA